MSRLEVRELTPRGRGALSVLQLRGKGALEAVRVLAPNASLKPGALRVAELRTPECLLDQALILVRDDQLVELHLHGSPTVVADVLSALAGAGPGIRTLELEELAAELLATAPCEFAARMLLDQAQGALRVEIERLRALPDGFQLEGLTQLLGSARVARYALTPARVFLCGPVNAGKSTLFNALLGAERVLVSDVAGTTRDVVVERVQLEGWPVDLYDTPGQRSDPAANSPSLELELAGLRLTEALSVGADALLWITPVDAEGATRPGVSDPHWITIRSCADRLPTQLRSSSPRDISALTDPRGAVREVARRLREHLALPSAPWQSGRAVPFTALQCSLLESALVGAPDERRACLSRLLVAIARPATPCVAADEPLR